MNTKSILFEYCCKQNCSLFYNNIIMNIFQLPDLLNFFPNKPIFHFFYYYVWIRDKFLAKHQNITQYKSTTSIRKSNRWCDEQSLLFLGKPTNKQKNELIWHIDVRTPASSVKITYWIQMSICLQRRQDHLKLCLSIRYLSLLQVIFDKIKFNFLFFQGSSALSTLACPFVREVIWSRLKYYPRLIFC